MQTVEKCINELNDNNYYEEGIKNSYFLNLIGQTRKAVFKKRHLWEKLLDFILSAVTVIGYEKIFYEKQSDYTKNTVCLIMPELKNAVAPKRLITNDFVSIDLWDINLTNSKKYIIFCEGVGSEKSTPNLQRAYLKFAKSGFGVVTFDYRGRGKSSGDFSQKGALQDVLTVYNYLKSKGIKENDIGIVGHSMGAGVAADFSSKIKLAFTILINPFSKAADMAKNIAGKIKMPPIIKQSLANFPSFLIPLKNKFDNEKALKNIETPIFLLHSTYDETIPVELARNLYKKHRSKSNIYYTELTDSDHEINEEKTELCINFIENLT